MSGVAEAFRQALSGLIVRIVPGARRIEGLRRLSAGATLETWSFDAVGDGGDGAVGSVDPPTHAGSGGGTAVIKVCHPLILRRSPGGLRSVESLSLETEADLIRALADSGAPVPTVVHTLVPPDGLGDGFLMTRIEGETIPRKILRDAAFADVRPRLTAQFGEILAAIHRVDTARLPALPVKTPASVLDRMQQRYEQQKRPSAVIDVGLHWLRANAPDEPRRRQLVHGDFRNGNLIVGAEGVRAVLDWEVAHLGDPAEDLAWICLPPWRFGEIDRPVGGLGKREELFRAYEAASGERVDPERVRFWEGLGSLRWAIGCAGMFEWFDSGRDPSVERAMIARRVSESELDLLRVIAARS